MSTTHTKEHTGRSENPKEDRLPEQPSLRDYFAAKAMQGLLEDSAPGRFKYDATALARLAEIAYQFSDAMLAERAKASQAEP